MQELDLTFRRLVSIWWLTLWRTVVGAVISGTIIAIMVKVLVAIASVAIAGSAPPVYPSEDLIARISAIAGGAFGAYWGYIVFKMAFRKRYKDFRIALLPIEPNISN